MNIEPTGRYLKGFACFLKQNGIPVVMGDSISCKEGQEALW